jgi:hypothetical protein
MTATVSLSATTVRDLVVKCKATVEELRVALALSTTPPEVIAELGAKVESLEADVASSLMGGGGTDAKALSASSASGGNIITNVIPQMTLILHDTVSVDVVSNDSKVLGSSCSSSLKNTSSGTGASVSAIGSKRPRNDALPSANMFDDEEEAQRPQGRNTPTSAAVPAEPVEATSSLRSLSEREKSMYLPPLSPSSSGEAPTSSPSASRHGFFFGLDTMVAPLPFSLNTVTLKKPDLVSTSGGVGRGGGGRSAFRGRRGGRGGRR